MNQVKDWAGSCQRCYRATDIHTMSMFDVSLICMDCAKTERNHPQYSQAAEAERSEVKSGNRNFKGIGAPSELRPGMEWEQLDKVK
jgi:hypothetical protein